MRNLLDAGAGKLADKLTEEAGELGRELEAGARARVVAEASDLLFHLMCALASRDVALGEVLGELSRRFGTSGIDEKEGRARGEKKP